jgi:hypothetical protein
MALPKIFDYVRSQRIVALARTWHHHGVYVNKTLYEFASLAVTGPRKLGGTKLM